MEISFQSPATNGGAAAHKGKTSKSKGKSRGKNSNKLVGIRQRPSGRWVAEIKDTTKKIRMWLGTFETAEEAARAYDEAACLLRGSNTRTNFIPQFPTNSPIASRIRTLLNNKKKTPIPKPIAAVSAADPTVEEGRMFDGAYKPDMSNCLEETEMGVWDCGNGVSILEDLEVSDFERMKVERQISASLYAMNGVHEYMEAVHQASESIWDLTPICSLFS